ncbi:Histidine phosphatase superfamily [Carpediemonas membranifera]|uniref:Inositol hexakisphosphate and diphosphoinositol-pentakisphosphate kinase n=1 Tax=Carpediemonas membranifera TaxID=201153 RepID=A0A8J6B5Y5_9EUKA|nr:Histidine phosphatase superfamily [Carpediemonas membranifera]|eukprot:KAG9393542.1 Histidine phosphatase superfamily [Carpediemonas membranifera]
MPLNLRPTTLEQLPDFNLLSKGLSAHRDSSSQVLLGICVLEKKARSKPMREIVKRITSHGDIKVVYFPNDLILHQPIENWPVVDVLISFYSDGFPLKKAISYVDTVHPFCINDLRLQQALQDRREVYSRLKGAKIPVARHFAVSRDRMDIDEADVVFDGSTLSFRGFQTLQTPFVEKPVDGEDHNVWIYFGPESPCGPGVRRLFRKVDCKSSEFFPGPCDVRRDGAYLYEEFLEVKDAKDLKAYTVLPDYVHGELRKTPALDGIVERDDRGKEVREVCVLSHEERRAAKMIGQAFGQRVCGFDILRKPDKSFIVCDVNGWSFVKGDHHYYDHTARVLRQLVIQAKSRLVARHENRTSEDMPPGTTEADLGQLEAVVCVARYADRRPKGKIKVVLPISIVNSVFGRVKAHTTISRDRTPQKVLEFHETLLKLRDSDAPAELRESAMQLVRALDDERLTNATLTFHRKECQATCPSGKNTEAVVVLKWGGRLSHAGVSQTREAALAFAEGVLPADRREDFLKEMRIFHSSEARTSRTAEVFYETLASAYPDAVAPAAQALVTEDRMLQWKAGKVRLRRRKIDKKLVSILLANRVFGFQQSDYTDEEIASLLPTGLKALGNPTRALKELTRLMERLVADLGEAIDPEGVACGGEPHRVVLWRWTHLLTRLRDETCMHTAVIKDIYDAAKYDAIHNRQLVSGVSMVYPVVHGLAELVIGAEYGITPQDKRSLANRISSNLLNAIITDLELAMHGTPFITAANTRWQTPVLRSVGLPLNHKGSNLNIADLASIRENDPVENEPDIDALSEFSVLSTPGGLGDPQSMMSDLRGFSVTVDTAFDPATFDLSSPEMPQSVPRNFETSSVVPVGLTHREWERQMRRQGPGDTRSGRLTMYFADTTHITALTRLFLYTHVPGLSLNYRPVSDMSYLSHLVFKLYRTVDGKYSVRVELSTGASHNPFQALGQDHALPIDTALPLIDCIKLPVLRNLFNRLAHSSRSRSEETLKGILAVFRHGDRTPKQKVKVRVQYSPLLGHLGDLRKDLVIKAEYEQDWMGRFVQILEDAVYDARVRDAGLVADWASEQAGLRQVLSCCKSTFDGLKIQAKDRTTNGVPGALLICKWGGSLTRAGRHQAKKLGAVFRESVLPSDPVKKRQFLANAKVYTNNERRVHRSAITFSQALFSPDPIPADLVQENSLLIEQPKKLSGLLDKAKEDLRNVLLTPPDLYSYRNMASAFDDLSTRLSPELLDYLTENPNPEAALIEVYSQIEHLIRELEPLLDKYSPETNLGPHETLDLMMSRWKKARDDFKHPKTGVWDTSKIPDIFDGIKFDALHSCREDFLLGSPIVDTLKSMYEAVVDLANIVIPHEYGMTADERLRIATYSTGPLMYKLARTADNMMFEAVPSLRLYFTSESHLHGILNLLLMSGVEGMLLDRSDIVELDFFTHVVFKVYESAASRFRIEVLFSTGATHNPFRDGDGTALSVEAPVLVHEGLTPAELQKLLPSIDFSEFLR